MIVIKELNQKNVKMSDLYTFFANYKFEKKYFDLLGLSDVQKIEFIIQKIIRRFSVINDLNKLFALYRDKEIICILGIDQNNFHSLHFGRDIIEIGPIYIHSNIDITELNDSIDYIICKYIYSKDNPILKSKTDDEDVKTNKLLLELGYLQLASTVKMLYNHNESHAIFLDQYNSRSKMNVKGFEIEDVKSNMDINSFDFLIDQHYLSIHFSIYNSFFHPKLTKSLFKKWFDTFTKKKNSHIIQVNTKNTHHCIGISCFQGPIKVSDSSIYSRELTIIDKEYNGMGLAGNLYNRMINLTQTFIEGCPLIDNTRNIALNERCGFQKVQVRNHYVKAI
jgi:hypothetical protein